MPEAFPDQTDDIDGMHLLDSQVDEPDATGEREVKLAGYPGKLRPGEVVRYAKRAQTVIINPGQLPRDDLDLSD